VIALHRRWRTGEAEMPPAQADPDLQFGQGSIKLETKAQMKKYESDRFFDCFGRLSHRQSNRREAPDLA
jgi:hypothetical protein